MAREEERKIVDEILKDAPYLKSKNAYKVSIEKLSAIASLTHEEEMQKYNYLFTPNMLQQKESEIRKILALPYWEMDEYKDLLSSNIWHSKKEEITIIFESGILDRYPQLKNKSIFNLNLDNMFKVIDVLKKYNIDNYITNRCCRRTSSELEMIIMCMIDNDIPLIEQQGNEEYALNQILNIDKSRLKKEFGIDMERIKKRYGKVINK